MEYALSCSRSRCWWWRRRAGGGAPRVGRRRRRVGAGGLSTQDQAVLAKEDHQVVVPAQNRVIRCRQVPCYGTGSHDLIYERKGNGKRDRIFLRGRRNQVRADRYPRDKDVIRSSGGYDPIYVNDGDTHDKNFGGKGNNECYVDARSAVGGACSRVRVR